MNVLLVAALRSSTGLLDTNSLGRVGGLLVTRVNVPKRLRYTVVNGPMPKLRQRPECGSTGSVFVIVRLYEDVFFRSVLGELSGVVPDDLRDVVEASRSVRRICGLVDGVALSLVTWVLDCEGLQEQT